MKFEDLVRAVYRKDLAGIDSLVAAGGDLDARDADGRTALMHAVLASDADERTVARLIERGADVNVHDAGQQWTALHFACRDQKKPIVEALLEGGADLDARDAFGNTPLLRVFDNAKVDLSIVRLLIAHGADPDRPNNYKVSARVLAQRMGMNDALAEFDRRS